MWGRCDDAAMSAPGAVQLGKLIRHQRELQSRSLREVAQAVGISGPYLSQIERGLRAPSDRVIEEIARSLEMSAGTLNEVGASRAGRAPPDPVTAIMADRALTARQRESLVETYRAFVAMNRTAGPPGD